MIQDEQIWKSLANNSSLFQNNMNMDMNMWKDLTKTTPPELIVRDMVSAEEIRNYQNSSLELLKQITENTAGIVDLVNLVSESKDKQDEIISIMAEILEIAKTKSKEDAGNKFTKVMKKISCTIDNANTIVKLSSFAMLAYNLVVSNIDKLHP